MQFKPKSESEISKYDLLPPGTYPFTVLESAETASKSAKNAGKLMVKLKLNVHGPNSDRHVYDYFADWFSEWKLKHFCDTTGMVKDYEAGTLDATRNALAGRQGWVQIEVEDDATYGEKNVVEDYGKPEKAEANKQAESNQDVRPPDDDIPF